MYFPLRTKSCYSLLSGLTKPADIADRLGELELSGNVLADSSSVSGAVQYLKSMNESGKKPVIGCDFNICKQDATIKTEENKALTGSLILAKNDNGWLDLIKMVSMANSSQQSYHKPRLSLNQLGEFGQKKNTISISGAINTHVGKAIVVDGEISPDWKKRGEQVANWYKDVFGENFYLETQLFNADKHPIQKKLSECVREIAQSTNIKCVATPDSYYLNREGAIDQRVLLCSNMNITLKQGLSTDSVYFHSAQYFLPSYEEMLGFGHTKEELDNTVLLADSVSKYEKILNPPVLPKFDCPNGMSEKDYLRQLCREGWKKKIENKIDKAKHQTYIDRVEYELGVLESVGLSAYFLIVADIINFVRSNGWLPGCGRGSAAGCLVSYLIGITAIDPIPYGLIFERFYNVARAGSMPDIDMDVPIYAREYIIEYLKKKYGSNHVGQIATFHSIKGRGALKAVFRAHGGISFDEMNEITCSLIDDYKIADELQMIKEEEGSASIIEWCLENTPNKLKKWAYYEGDTIKGVMADRFNQAIRMEGVKTTLSKHAAGVVISPKPLNEMFPIMMSKDDGNLVGFEMNDVESVGGIKLDVLGLAFLDKMMGIKEDLATGEIHEIQRPRD